MSRDILILNERDLTNPLAGGAEVHLFETFGRLAARGHRVRLLCSSYPGSKREETIGGIRVRRLANRYLFYAAVLREARLEAARGRGDVIVDVLCKLPFLSPWFVGVPCVAIVHHLFGTTAFAQAPFPVAAVTWTLEKLIPFAYRESLCIAVSPSTKADLVTRGIDPSHVVIVPNGVDHDLYRPGPSSLSETPLVVWLGRAEPYKRPELLLEAVARIIPAHPTLRVEVVGEGSAMPALRMQAQRLGLGASVSFRGFVEGEVKVGILQRAWVMVNTSEKEGWGLTVMEGGACGVPTVASAVPGLRDSVRHGVTGLLVPHADVDALAAALSAILGDTAMRERMRGAAIEWANRFTWDFCAKEVERMLEAIADGARPQDIRPSSRLPFS